MARLVGDFEAADAFRVFLEEAGYMLEDLKTGGTRVQHEWHDSNGYLQSGMSVLPPYEVNHAL